MLKKMEKPVLVGAVVYDPKVVTIWEIIKDFFEKQGTPMDFVFYSNYELQVQALLDGQIDVAWNSPLAWVESERWSGGTCRAIAMRDTDQDRCTHIVVRSDGPVQSIEDLRGKTIAVGAKDSPQATLIPLGLLNRHGLKPGEDVQVRRFDVLVGKHGDHIGGEKDAFDCLKQGQADACAMLDLNWQLWSSDGTIDTTRFKTLATTDKFDHCVFTVRDDFPREREDAWLKTLFSMSYDNSDHREMMDMEGLKEWKTGRTSGFGPLNEAVDVLGFMETVDR
jgi:phosphonate transport system substrate-binding protein